ncbi:MAG: DUF4912 domain-containing protein [Treponema sp.]|nr:DUF4912 domain-containing protein [Treponema sp.]
MAELTLPYLESLSSGELIDLAVKKGLDIPPGLERVFIIEELFYLDHEPEGAAAQGASAHGAGTQGTSAHGAGAKNAHYDINQVDDKPDTFKEYATLPKQYHLSFIEVLIRDPLWAFAFWEIKTHDRAHYESMAGFGGYYLRIMPLKEEPPATDEAASFIVSIDIDDYARYLGFPPDGGRRFKVELCIQCHEHYTVLAQSRPFTLPRLIEPASNELIQTVYGNPLARLSGAGRFSLVRSEDRLLRSREKSPSS